MTKKLVVLTGPTAVGKTALSIELAKYFNTEIISADSRQFYKELKIGTAPPSENELKEVKHHFIFSHSIHDYYSAGKFEIEALHRLKELFEKYDVVILVGGSGLYIDLLCNGMDNLPGANPEIRKELDKILLEQNSEALCEKLKELDPEYYHSMDTSNIKRVYRALEICLTTHQTYSAYRTNIKKERPFKTIKICLNIDRNQLYERINKRVDMMLKTGLLEEAQQLYPYKNLNSLNTVGYKELFSVFSNELELTAAIDLIKRNSRRYAKRQLTWFRRNDEYTWFNPSQKEEIIQHIKLKLTE